MNVMLFIRLVGQLYAKALSGYRYLDIDLFSVMHVDWQNIILVCFDCNINFEIFLTYDLPLRQHSLLKLTCCKLAIINVINIHRLNKTFSRSEGVAKLIIMVWSVPNFRQEFVNHTAEMTMWSMILVQETTHFSCIRHWKQCALDN